MNIEEFFNCTVIVDKDYDTPFETKLKEFEYCIPLCDDGGYFIELGVWKAKSLRHMANKFPLYKFYGFDSFEGVSEEWDLGGKKIDMRRFKEPKLPEVPDNVTLVKGLFEDTLQGWLDNNRGPISFINMDPDIYSATIYALETLNDRIVPGTIIRFDELTDWQLFDETKSKKQKFAKYTKWQEGEWKALNEWLEKYDRVVTPLWRNWHQSAGVRIER